MESWYRMDATLIISIILFSFGLFGLVIAIYLFFAPKTLMGKKLGFMFLSSSIATFVYPLQFLNPALEDMFPWVVIRYSSLLIFLFSIMFFVFDYIRNPISLRSIKFLSLTIIPGLAIVFLAVNPNSAVLYHQIGLEPIKMFLETDWMIVVAYFILQAYGVGLIITLIYCLLRNFNEQTRLTRINSVIITSGIFLYLITHLLQLGGVRLMEKFSLNMFTYFPSSLLALWGIRRFRLSDIRSIAYSNIFKQNHNGLLIVDQHGYLVDFNGAAEKYLAVSNQLRAGEQFDTQILNLPSLPKPETFNKSLFSRIEVQGMPLQVEISALVDQQNVFYAYLVGIQDITSLVETEKIKEAELIRQEVWSERTKLARNLHDSTLQNIGSLILLSGSLQESFENQHTSEALKVLQYLETGARLAYEDLRTLIKELHMDDSPVEEFRLIKALKAKVHLLNQQYSACVSIKTLLEFPLEPQYQRELYYIIIEALNNALKHADAKTISITLESNHEFFSVEITDNGTGFDVHHPPKNGMGLENMRSRTAMINGFLSIKSLPAEGTTVRIELPLNKNRTPL